MINLYDITDTDFSTLGMAVLDNDCISGVITEKINGEYNLTLELEKNEKTVRIRNEMVIKAPAPVRETPQIEPTVSKQREIYRVNTTAVNMRTKASSSTGYIINAYKGGTEMQLLEKTSSSWYKVCAPDGKSGYVAAQYLSFVRNEGGVPINNGTLEPHATREQLFRICSIDATLDTIRIDAIHVSYDLRRNWIKEIHGKRSGSAVLSDMMGNTVAAHEFSAYSDISAEVSDDIVNKTVIAAILSDGGLVAQAGGEVLRDNFDIYWVEHIGLNRGVVIEYRHNMAGMDIKTETSDLVTRIIPCGYRNDGKAVYGDPVDSLYINNYAQPFVSVLDCKDLKIGSNNIRTEAELKAKLAERARAEYSDKKVDIPKITASVDYVELSDVYGLPPQEIFLGDTIKIVHEDYGYNFDVEVVAYEYDCLTEMFTSIELGSVTPSIVNQRISPSQIPNNAITARTMANNAGWYLDMSGNASVQNAVNAGMASISGNFVSKDGGEINGRLGVLDDVHVSGTDYASLHLRQSGSDVNKVSYRANVQTGRAQIREHVAGDNYENYMLPAPDNASGANYNILTSKSPVTVAQGGTGAKSGPAALDNLGLFWEADSKGSVGTANITIDFKVSFPSVPVVVAVSSTGYPVVSSVTKTGFTVRNSAAGATVYWIAIVKPTAH